MKSQFKDITNFAMSLWRIFMESMSHFNYDNWILQETEKSANSSWHSKPYTVIFNEHKIDCYTFKAETCLTCDVSQKNEYDMVRS